MEFGGDNMKKFIMGFVLGAFLFSIMPVSAAIEEYILYRSEASITINGTKSINPNLPILNYNGYNYIPAKLFQEICAIIGVDFKWVGDIKQIQLNTNITPPTTSTGGNTVSTATNKTYIKDGLEVTLYNSIEYVKPRDIRDQFITGEPNPGKHFPKFEFDFSVNENTDTLRLYKIEDGIQTTLIESISMMKIAGRGYIEYSYYINTIQPLVSVEQPLPSQP
jgi:hypothetical protein